MYALDEVKPQTDLQKIVIGNSSGRRNSGSAQEVKELGPKIMDV
jgi:hypothetical protein